MFIRLPARGPQLLTETVQGGLSGVRSLQLAGEDAHKLVLEPLVLAKHVANLAGAHSNVSSWHISVRPCITQALWIEAML